MDLSIKILIVDDFASMRRIIRNMLKNIGFVNMVEVENGQSALDSLKNNDIGLIVSDWNMPKMTGLELLKAVKKNDMYKNIPFLMITAEAQRQNIIEAVQAGVSNYVVKPFTAETLTEKIKKIFVK